MRQSVPSGFPPTIVLVLLVLLLTSSRDAAWQSRPSVIMIVMVTDAAAPAVPGDQRELVNPDRCLTIIVNSNSRSTSLRSTSANKKSMVSR
jgi:hypothetical protein